MPEANFRSLDRNVVTSSVVLPSFVVSMTSGREKMAPSMSRVSILDGRGTSATATSVNPSTDAMMI